MLLRKTVVEEDDDQAVNKQLTFLVTIAKR